MYASSRVITILIWAVLAGCGAMPPSTALDAPSSGWPTSVTPVQAPTGWTLWTLPGHVPGANVVAFHRQARVQPARYQVIVIPGSGCTRWAPIAERYFAGLRRAAVVVLHKPYVDVMADADAACPPIFTAHDALSSWRDAATAALAALPNDPGAALPRLVVGISEGAELLPHVAASMSNVSGVVMMSASGLDPATAGAAHAAHIGQLAAWEALRIEQASDLPDDRLVQGRTLRYWRDFWRWSLTEQLVSGPWPLLRVWGDADATLPARAYLMFNPLASDCQVRFCDVRLPGADHALQNAEIDGIQWLWRQLERWARQPGTHLCDVVSTP